MLPLRAFLFLTFLGPMNILSLCTAPSAFKAMLQIPVPEDISAWPYIGSDPTSTLIFLEDMLFVDISM